MKRIWMFLLLALFLTACGSSGAEQEHAEYQIYYVNKEGTGLKCQGYDTDTAEPVELVEEFLARMDEHPKDTFMHPARPEAVTINEFLIEDAFLYVDYVAEYASMDAVTEVLYRAAAVKTLVQIEEVEGVCFEIEGVPLTDAKGNAVGIMTEDSFVTNTSQDIEELDRTTITLYFASEDGKSLKKENVEVVYNVNVSMEKLIMEELISGPKAKGYLATIPSDTKLLNISVKDGTCYVNLNEKLQNLNAGLTEDVVIYSIVNSLTELSTINKVQISVNGETNMVLRESRSLDKLYERNPELIAAKEQ